MRVAVLAACLCEGAGGGKRGSDPKRGDFFVIFLWVCVGRAAFFLWRRVFFLLFVGAGGWFTARSSAAENVVIAVP